jgi:hypothetical protein
MIHRAPLTAYTATTTLNEARATLPRAIRAVEFADPVLTIIGEEWSLNLMCPWQIEGPDWSYTWESETIDDDAWELVGHNLIGILSPTPDILDPVFEFDGGIRLSVLADSDIDPWVLRLPGLIIVGRRGGS